MAIRGSKGAGGAAKGAKNAAAGTARSAAGNVTDSVEAVRQSVRSVAAGAEVQARVAGDAGRGARTGAQVGAQVGTVVGTFVEEVARRAGEAAGSVVEGYSAARGRVQAADPAGLVRQLGETLEGVVEDGRSRATALAQPQRRVPARRPATSGWPWALGASVAGAAAGVGVVLLVRRLLGHDVPGAQEPEQLRAVVDSTPAGGTSTPGGSLSRPAGSPTATSGPSAGSATPGPVDAG